MQVYREKALKAIEKVYNLAVKYNIIRITNDFQEGFDWYRERDSERTNPWMSATSYHTPYQVWQTPRIRS